MGFGPEHNDKRSLEEKVDAIPGGDGWYQDESPARDEYLRSAQTLVRLGMTEDEAVLFLDDLYAAAKSCFGG